VESLLGTLFASDTRPISALDVLFAVTLPFLLCFVVTLVYRRTQKTHNYSVGFLHSIFLFSSLTSIVTLIVGVNVASGFGLIGSLSIIRFRNALKSPLDAIYIFWALVIGMACGNGLYFAAVLLTFACALMATFLDLIKYGEPSILDSILKISAANDAEAAAVPQIEQILGAQARSFRRVNVLYNSDEPSKTFVYHLRAGRKVNLPGLQTALGAVPGVLRIHHLNSEAPAFLQ
jgi:hypothetical protein